MRNSDRPYIRSSALIGLKAFDTTDSQALTPLLGESGLPENAFENPDMMLSFDRFNMLIELAAAKLQRPYLGLEWAQNGAPDFPNFGPVTFLRRFAGSLEDWLMLSLKYWAFHTNAFTIRLIADPKSDNAILRCATVPFTQPSRQFIESAMAILCMLAQQGLGQPLRKPARVRFRHRAPRSTQLHEKIFDCPIEFNALHDEMLFNRRLLAQPIVGNLKVFRGVMETYIKVRLKMMPKPDQSVSTAVALSISSLLGSRAISIEEIAVMMNVKPKKLQRLLADEGNHFSQILDNVRENTARNLLLESDIPIASISGLLDYSTPPAFNLAFKRWTGQTPQAYRRLERLRLGKEPTDE